MKKIVGNNIRNLRQEKSITQTELADKVNKSLRTIQKYETGEIFPSIANIRAIAEVLEVDPYKDILDDAQPVDDENVTKQKKKIENPAKTWKRRKRKNGNGMTKSYYNKNGDSITSDEYDQKMEAYKKAKKKSQGGTPDHSSYRFTDFKHMLLESITEHESKQNINSYNKLKEYLTNNLSN